jgi:hypothetical protein
MHAFILVLVMFICVAGCSANKGDAPITRPTGEAAPATRPATFTGTLRGGMMAIGGETTGWTLVGDAQTGGIQVDVSRVQARAQKHDGKRVTITGRMTEKDYVESGKTQVLVAEKIEAAPDPAAR